MKKLHSLAFYTLVTPAIALGSSALLAAPESTQDIDPEHKSTEYDRDGMNSTSKTDQSDKDKMRTGQSDSWTDADRNKMRDQSLTENRGYMDSVPANGLQASNLMGADVKTTGDESVGPVNDLILDDQGKIVALVIGVGGFLGMGERDVAIGWDDVTRSGTADDLELRVDVTREGLSNAPEFETYDLDD